MNVEETAVMRMFTHTSAVKNMIDQKQPENMDYFELFGQHNNKRCNMYTGN